MSSFQVFILAATFVIVLATNVLYYLSEKKWSLEKKLCLAASGLVCFAWVICMVQVAQGNWHLDFLRVHLLLILALQLSQIFVTDFLHWQIVRINTLIPVLFLLTQDCFYVGSLIPLYKLWRIGFAYGLLFVVNWFFKLWRKQDGIGDGDMEMLGMLGYFFGLQKVFYIISLAAYLAIVYLVLANLLSRFSKSKMQRAVPMGCFLGLATVAILVWEKFWLAI